ncbi:mRNA triphosphatase [Rhodotorula paludigena]|uniref:mRNA triphosphatase n=1 Tax=Rhodotorula paludigena TaxID=86838 RepID=UPI0031792940
MAESLFSPASAHPPPQRPPRPSPSLSPSINSLLNDDDDDDAHRASAGTPFDHDYFGGNGAPPDPHAVFGAPATSVHSPSPTSAAPAHPAGFASLLQPDPPPHAADAQPRPRSSHKRPRPTSSSSSLGSFGSLLTPDGHPAAPADEAEGAMEPPTTRVRRSSSISSNPGAPARPSSAGGPPSRRSSSPSRPGPPGPPPPPPPPAPAPAPASTAAPSAPSASRTAPPAPPPPPPAIPRRASESQPPEPSIFNVEPIDEFTREVADWLWGFCAQLDWDKVEIEAKIGLLVDSRGGGMRMNLPVPIETILTDDTGLRFESNMTQNQHKAFNLLLNSRVEESAHPSYPAAPVRYAHTRELDTFHDVTLPGGGGGRRKVRVTRDQKDKSRVSAVEKVRVADMNVFSPKRRFDWRVSVSLEMPAPVPDTPPTHSRHKDRISYSHQHFRVDLTQVQSTKQPQPTHELEIEFKRARPLLEEAAKEQRGEDNRYLEMVQGLLNNVRMLIRNASDP